MGRYFDNCPMPHAPGLSLVGYQKTSSREGQKAVKRDACKQITGDLQMQVRVQSATTNAKGEHGQGGRQYCWNHSHTRYDMLRGMGSTDEMDTTTQVRKLPATIQQDTLGSRSRG